MLVEDPDTKAEMESSISGIANGLTVKALTKTGEVPQPSVRGARAVPRRKAR